MSGLLDSLPRIVPRFVWLADFRCRYGWLDKRHKAGALPPSVDYKALLRDIDDLNRRLAGRRN
jgi:hypothetical protein